MRQPTAACRVILTRPQGRNGGLADLVRRAGLAVIEAPALEIEPLDTPRPNPRAGDLLVFVSGQAVDAYFSGRRMSWPDGARACAVGTATARALEAHVPDDCILAPEAGQPPDSESLLAAIDGLGLKPARAHILRATQGRDWLAGQLRQRGWDVACHALYRRSPRIWDRPACLALAGEGPVVLLVTSLEALDAIETSLRAQGLIWPRRLRIVTLHERIGRRLQCLYADRPDGVLHVTLSSPDEAALFQAIVAASRQLP